VIVCGNHSQIEKDVFDILLKGNQPIILVLARGMKTRWEAHIMDAIVAERLLIVSPFKPKTKRVTRDTAQRRNQEIIKISDRIVTGHITEGGQLSEILMKENPHKL
jgi:hypothetical protein